MRACPKCGARMQVAKSISVGGLENKEIAWLCDRDGVTAELRHPVQYVHLKLGDVEEMDGRRRRLIRKEIVGAELVVYHRLVVDAGLSGKRRASQVQRKPRAKPSARAKRRAPPRGKRGR